MNILRRWGFLPVALLGFFGFPEHTRAAYSLILTNGYGDCYRMNMLRDRYNYQAYRGVCSYRGFSLSGCSTTGEVVMLRIMGTASCPEHYSILSTSLRWGTTMYVLNDVFWPLSPSVMAGYENWYPFDMSCTVAMYVYSGGFSVAGGVPYAADEGPLDAGRAGPPMDEQRLMMELLNEPAAAPAEPHAYSLVMTNGYGDCYRMNMLRDRYNYQAYRGVCSYRGFSLSGCSTTGEVVMLRIMGTASCPEHYSILSTSLRWGTTMYVLNDVFWPLSPSVMAGYENWYPFDMSCTVAMYVSSGGFGAHGTERAAVRAWPGRPASRVSTASKADRPLRIGALVPLTGDLEDIGSSYTSAYGKAISEITNALGMADVELLVENTDADPLVAAMKLEALYTNGVQVVVGPETSAECEALRLLATNGVGMLLVSSSATAVPLAIPNDPLMRLTMDDSHQARALASRIADDGITNLAVLKRSDMYGGGMKDAFYAEYTNRGGTVFFDEYFPRSPDLFGEVMSNVNEVVAARIAETGEDGVGLLIVAFDEGVRLLEESAGFPALTSVRWYGTEGMAGNAALLTNVVSREVARRTRFICSQPAAYTNAKYAEVAAHIQGETGHVPRTFSVQSYDALWLAALALRDTGGTGSVEQVTQAIRTNAAVYSGATGPIVFNNADDRADGEYTFLKVSDTQSWDNLLGAVPNAPIERSAVNVTSNRFDARWHLSVGATNHLLYVAEDPEGAACLPGFDGASFGGAGSAAIEGLAPGQTYYYRVRAANAFGTSADSGTVTVRVWEAACATNGVPLWWLGQYYPAEDVATNADGLALSDSDGDGHLAWEECVAGTSPVDSRSRFAVGGLALGSVSNMVFQWESVTGRSYSLFRETNVVPGLWNESLFDSVPGTGETLYRTNPVDLGVPRAFFRLVTEKTPSP
ncbi:MAG TPA: ABC transporter substrate-binding protein [Kiritimatiellia bacterium]|nr:ABC transporter substrate-binding protein [Kiritimatiellia bacterium]